MSDEDGCAFENWQEAAEQLEKQELEQKNQKIKPSQATQPDQISDALNQQQKAQKAPIDPKQVLRNKIKQYQEMTLEDFQAIQDEVNEHNKIASKKVGNPVLKSDKDFNNYARTLAKRFDSIVQSEQATIDDQKLSLFFEQLTLYMYKNLEWKNLHQVQAKLRVLKKQRKTDQEKRRKQKQKEERAKKLQGDQQKSQSQAVSKKQKKGEDDLFGGVSNVNSKQQEEERKNKIIIEEKKEIKKEESDDDDFM